MSTLRISNIEAKSVPASATVDEKVKITNSSGDTLVFIDGKTSGITTVGINTTDSNITFDANSNIVVTGIITATKFVGEFEPTSVGIADSIFHTGDTNTSINFSTDTVSIETAGDERLRITSGGNVNIGGNYNQSNYNLSAYEATNKAALQVRGGSSSHATANIWCYNDQSNWLALGVFGSGATTSGLITANDAIVGANNNLSIYSTKSDGIIKFGAGSSYPEKARMDSSGRFMIGNTNASTMNSNADDVVIGNTSGDHGITIISQNNGSGRLMFADTYTAGTGTYEGQILYYHNEEMLNFYANYTNNPSVAMQLGGSNNQLFVGITKGSTTTYNNRSAFFHSSGGISGNFISITTGSNEIAGIVFGDSIANNTANYESYMYHDNSSNDFWIRVNAGSDNRHLKIKQGGNVEIGNGNLVLADGHGIDFNADSNASGATSELLDDYETGTWTPNVVGSSGSDAWSYRSAGKYTKIGNKVTASWSLGQYNGNLSGSIYIDNLPFVVNFRQYGGDTGLYNVDVPSGTIIGYFVYLPDASTQVRPYWSRSGQAGTAMDGSELRGSNQTFWEGNVTYYTNS